MKKLQFKFISKFVAPNRSPNILLRIIGRLLKFIVKK